MPDRLESRAGPRRGWPAWFWGLFSLYAGALLAYSQTWAFAWDESYHLLAAQLIVRGRKPYLDFCFPQSPLNAYWNAGWMRVLGESWRVTHTVAALLTVGAVLLAADFAARRFPVAGWRTAAAVMVAAVAGLNAMVFLYGPLAQPYGICLFTVVAAFRLAVRSVERSGAWLCGVTGLFAGIAASSSLLTAVAAPVLLAWVLVYHRAGSRLGKCAAFCAGAAIPFAPVFRLFWLGPREAWFNLVEYHASFRRLYWPETTSHDVEVLTGWIDSGQALTIGLLAVVGLLYAARESQWPRALKAEFYLCAWLACGLSLELGLAHPTFAQYFLLTVPFLAILGVPGLYAIGSRMLQSDRPLWPVLLVSLLSAAGLGRAMFDHRTDATWSKYERLAERIDKVTAPGAPLFANEPIYFLTKRLPPTGYELDYTHRVDLPREERARLHIITDEEVKQQVQSGRFATAYSCEDDDSAEYGLKALYRREEKQSDCSIYWEWKGKR